MMQTNLQNRKRLTGWMPGEEWEDREFGMDMHTLLYLDGKPTRTIV